LAKRTPTEKLERVAGIIRNEIGQLPKRLPHNGKDFQSSEILTYTYPLLLPAWAGRNEVDPESRDKVRAELHE